MTTQNETSEHRPTTLVLGATGKTGRRIVDRLAALDVPTRLGSRSGEPPFDWTDRTTWAPVLRGVSAVYVSYFPDLSVPGAPDDVAAFVRQADAEGVERIVLLSGRGEVEAQRCEQIVQESTASWTILRASWFAQNFSEDYLRDELATAGVLTLPVGSVGEPFVDVDDIADAAVVALTEDGHAGRLYELTGPRLLTFAEAVQEIADAAGREFRFQRVTLDEYAAAMKEFEVPEDVQSLLTYLFSEVLDGRNEYLTGGVEEALGRPPRDFRAFARAAAATGAWSEER